MSCITLLGNTGESNCRTLMAKAKGLILVSAVNSSGATPSINPSVSLTDTIINNNINAASKLDRWFPIMDLKAVTNERAENEYFTYPDGTREFNRDGVRSTSYTRPSGTAAFLKKIQTWECVNAMAYVIDEDGNIQGELNTLGMVEPIAIELNTFSANLIFGSDTQKSSSIKIAFDYSSLVNDGDLVVLQPASGVNLLRKQGLIDINVTTGATSTTTLGLTIDNGSGYINSLDAVEGLVTADFTAYNVTTAAAVVVVATEPTAGNYVLTFSAQTLANVIRVTIAKDGLETSITTHVL